MAGDIAVVFAVWGFGAGAFIARELGSVLLRSYFALGGVSLSTSTSNRAVKSRGNCSAMVPGWASV